MSKFVSDIGDWVALCEHIDGLEVAEAVDGINM
jgi:hypothetical protein